MNTTAPYTPLESLLLFQSLLQYGIEAAAFSQISQSLQNNSLIKGGKSYDAGRLSPESLQELFLQLLREELKSENEHAERPDTSLSPNSKKRKLQAPPLPTLQDARAHVAKLPLLVDRLYARYRDYTVREIREDEQKYEQLRQEITELERGELDEQANAEGDSAEKRVTADTQSPAGENGIPKVEDRKEEKLSNGTGPSLAPQAQENMQRSPAAAPRHPSPARQTPVPTPPTVAQPPVAPPSQFGQTGAPIRPPEPSKSPNGAPPVLQPPQGVPSFSPRPASTTPQPAASDVLQRPDAALKPKPPTPSPQVQPPVPGTRTLKWETPYQPQPPTALQQQQRPPQAGAAYPPLQRGHPPQQWSAQTHLQYPSPQPLQPQPPQATGQAIPSQPRPVLAQPQQAGQIPPTLQPAPIRPATESPGVVQQQRPPSISPVPLQARPPQQSQQQIYPQPPQIPPGRVPGGVSPVPPPATSTSPVPPQQWQQSANAAPHQPSLQPQPVAPGPPTSAAPIQGETKQPLPHKPTHIPLPPHILTQHTSTPGPSSKTRHTPILPQTPIALPSPFSVTQGSGTKWRSAQPTPSTPHPGIGDVESPAFEMLSPILQPATLPVQPTHSSPKKESSKPQKPDAAVSKATRGRASRSAQKAREAAETPVPETSRRLRSTSVVSTVDGQIDQGSAKVKREEDTPKPLDETGDTTADESLPSRRRFATPSRVSSRAINKRKRQDSVPTEHPPPSGAPTHVLWTRGFPRVSSSALDQIGSHRYANMFAHQIRERDAPGYKSIVLRPQDLKSIRTAIIAGNKAAAAAAAALPDGDPGTISVWLPITEDIIPPRGIINSAQLERELVHMFCNAIMYNPDPFRGPGPAFMRPPSGAKVGTDVHGHGGDVIGYKVDENSIVNDTQAMFVEVEKLLSDLRSTEAQPGAPPPALPPGAIPNSERLAGRGPHAIREPTATEDEGDDTTHTEAEGSGNTIKRRRIARG